MRWPTFALVALVLLSGCSGSSSSGGADGSSAASSSSGTVAPHGVTGLNWTVGRSWTHHITFGNASDASSFDNTVIVAKKDPTGWVLGSTDRTTAITDSAFFFQDLGHFTKEGNLEDSGFVFPFYSFPLSDNKTWTASEKNVGIDLNPIDHSLSLKAHALAAGAFSIEARNADGSLRAVWDYKPELQWFSSLELYSAGSATHLKTTASKASGTSGTYYTSEGKVLYTSRADYFQAPTPPTAGATTVTVPTGPTDLMFVHYGYGGPGGGESSVVAPDGTVYKTYAAYTTTSTPAAGDVAQGQVIVPAQVGDWHMEAGGAGPFASGYGIYAWSMTVASGTL